MAIETLNEWIVAGKGALDLIKGIIPLIPKHEDQNKITERVAEAEIALQKSNAMLAQKLDYTLCRCTFPPQIMLWKAERKKNICPVCLDENPPDWPSGTLTRGQRP